MSCNFFSQGINMKNIFLFATLFLVLLTSCGVKNTPIEDSTDNNKIIVYETRYKEVEKIKEIVPPNINVDFSPPMDEFEVSSKFGFRVDPLGNQEKDFDLHKGLDLVGSKNSQIKAVQDGIVVVHFPPPYKKFKGHPIYGGLVIIDHGNGLYTLYAHMKETYVQERQRVTKGQVIGIQGRTGEATGDHLHFEILVDPSYAIVKKK